MQRETTGHARVVDWQSLVSLSVVRDVHPIYPPVEKHGTNYVNYMHVCVSLFLKYINGKNHSIFPFLQGSVWKTRVKFELCSMGFINNERYIMHMEYLLFDEARSYDIDSSKNHHPLIFIAVDHEFPLFLCLGYIIVQFNFCLLVCIQYHVSLNLGHFFPCFGLQGLC